MKNYFPQCESIPGPSAYEAKSLSIALLDDISIVHFNVDRLLPEYAVNIYHHVVDVVKCLVVYYI